jgi:hypothetical protein
METRVSEKFSLKLPDFWRGLLLAVLSPILVFVQDWLTGSNELSWILIAKISVAALVGYLIKNFGIEPPKVIVSAETNTKAINASERIKDVA